MDLRVANYNTADPVSPDDLSEDDIKYAIETAINPIRWRYRRV